MNGLELSRRFYEAVGKPMLEEQFPQVLPYIAVGLVGSGSECYGYDDDISRDHDFAPSFCIFLPDETIVDRKTAFELERAYAKLPHDFAGITGDTAGAVGGHRRGVLRMDEFFVSKTGRHDGLLSTAEWLTVPEYALFEAVNGSVFEDAYGRFTEIRERLRYFPEDVRLKKLAGHVLLMGQAGQYNYHRCLSRGDTAAAQLALHEFVGSALNVVFLLNKQYMPYYKWRFRALRDLSAFSEAIPTLLERLLTEAMTPQHKGELIETICANEASFLRRESLTTDASAEMERHAYVVNGLIKEHNLRNSHILSGV